MDELTLTVSEALKTPASTIMHIKHSKALMKNLHMCTRTMEQSIDMLVESTMLQSPERRRSLLYKESSVNAQSKGNKEKGTKRKLLINVVEKENDNKRGRNGIVEDETKEEKPKRKRTQVKTFSPRFTGKHLDCTAQ